MSLLETYHDFVNESAMQESAVDRMTAPITAVLDDGPQHRPMYAEAREALEMFKSRFLLMYVALGLAGEAGEFAEKVKKTIRDRDGQLDPARLSMLLEELGDVNWYSAKAASVLGSSIEGTITRNMAKLKDRIARGVRKGEGDTR